LSPSIASLKNVGLETVTSENDEAF